MAPKGVPPMWELTCDCLGALLGRKPVALRGRKAINDSRIEVTTGSCSQYHTLTRITNCCILEPCILPWAVNSWNTSQKAEA